jgi:hypothetical protein
MTAAPPGLRLIEVTEKWAMGEYERCLAMIWSGQPDPEAMRRRAAQLVELCAKYPGKCALVEVVEPTSKPPDDQTRKIAMDVFRELGPKLSSISFVLEGGQMSSVLARAVITGMLFFLKQPQPSKVFKHVHDMANWVKPRIQPDNADFDAGLAQAFEHLREVMHSHGRGGSQ